MKKERIYHSWDKWEDHKAGFYDNISGKDKEVMINKVIELFTDSEKTKEYMMRVINEWFYSCQHNLSNLSMNRIAYIGQAAACLYCSSPNIITMNAWGKIDINYRVLADKIALKTILIWEQNQKLKDTLKTGNQKGIQTEYQMKLQLS